MRKETPLKSVSTQQLSHGLQSSACILVCVLKGQQERLHNSCDGQPQEDLKTSCARPEQPAVIDPWTSPEEWTYVLEAIPRAPAFGWTHSHYTNPAYIDRQPFESKKAPVIAHIIQAQTLYI